MENIKIIETFMSSCYPNMIYDIQEVKENYHVIIRNELLIRRYNVEDLYSPNFYYENGDLFDVKSIYATLENLIPHIYGKVFFYFIHPSKYNIEPITKPITVFAVSGYTTTLTTMPVYN
jgi:hypothetical protein